MSGTSGRLRPSDTSGTDLSLSDADEGAIPMQPTEITEILNHPMSQEWLARDLTRLAYVAQDGTPRSIPIAFTWNGAQIVLCTTKNAPKLPALPTAVEGLIRQRAERQHA